MKKDITEVVDNYLCHSCGSCSAICETKSISFNSTEGGYVVPRINYDTCINCGLCFAVCPGDHFTKKIFYNEDPFIGNINNIFSSRATSNDIYLNSQSGGTVTAILSYLFDSKKISAAIVTVMEIENNSFKAKPKIVSSSEELMITQKSKYVPVSINELLPEILKIDGNIAIVGLSCHFEGLENLFKLKPDLKNKIIKLGLICDRVLTETSIDFFKSKITKEPIKEFIFRDKTNTNYPGDISVKTVKGKFYKIDKIHRILMKNYFTPLRCRLCFDKMNVFADIVIGDPHGIEQIYPNGESLIISRNKLGDSIIKEAVDNKYILIRDADYKQAIKGQGIENKKISFSAYYAAWKMLGKKLPKYPSSIIKSLKPVNKYQLYKAKKDLLLSLKIDSFKKREDLLKHANRYYKVVLYKYKIIKILSIIKKIIKKGLIWL